MKNFFISYTGSDVDYATWVAEILEKSSYTVTIQAWDFMAGDNFVSKIDEALKECEKLIVILSESYLKSAWCEAEWTAKLAEQIKLKQRRVIPIRIEPLNLKGLLSPIVYIDIVDKTAEDAERSILSGIVVRNSRKSGGYPPFYSLEYHEIDIDYYVDDEIITYIKTCKPKILVGGKNSIHNRITWFRDETITLSSLTEGLKIEELDLRDTNLNYNVVFDHTLEKSEEVEYSVKAVLTNRHRHFRNFFSTEVITPIENLAMHLSISDAATKKVYTQKISSSPMNRRTEPPKEHAFHSPYHWHIQNQN